MKEKNTLPTLWNPTVIALATLFFTPIFGSILVTGNAKNLNIIPAGQSTLFWIRTTVVSLIAVIFIQILLPQLAFTRFLGLIALVTLWLVWFLTSGLAHIRLVKEKAPQYTHRLFAKPMLLGVMGYFAYALVSTTIAMGLYLAGDHFDQPSSPKTPTEEVAPKA